MADASSAIHPPIGVPRTKVRAGLLALFLGWMGAHWWYLGRRGAALVTLFAVACLAATRWFPVWYDNPAFFLLFIPMIEGFIESAILCLRSDEKFNRAYNPGRSSPAHGGWGPVLVALTALLVGSVCAMFAIAMVVVYVWTAMGWLEGYVL
jgi:TM2 domain-containing membrane protein YozV